MNVTVFGSGYVGLVTGACFADAGNNVICVDIDEEKTAKLKRGIVPIYEPGLEEIIKRNYKAGRIQFTTDIKSSLQNAEVVFIAVGTPPDEDGSADLKHVLAVAKSIGENIEHYMVVVDKSTVPVGTADKVRQTIAAALEKRQQQLEFDVISNPEFLKEGAAIQDFSRPDRIVIGSESERAIRIMRQLYQPFNRNHDRMLVMDIRSAEMTKYAANAMLATKISFMNEMANIAERVGADIEAVRHGIGSDKRIGFHFIYAGAGYGGSCFPKDVRALMKTAAEYEIKTHILDSVELVNNRQKNTLYSKLKQALNDDLKAKTIAVWGLAFKPNTDDMRDAPSRVLMEQLWQDGVKVQAFDPESMQETARIYPDQPLLTLCDGPYDALKNADALVICTDWKSFKSPDFHEIKRLLKTPLIIDGRNLYKPQMLAEYGFKYYGIGRGLSVSKFD